MSVEYPISERAGYRTVTQKWEGCGLLRSTSTSTLRCDVPACVWYVHAWMRPMKPYASCLIVGNMRDDGW